MKETNKNLGKLYSWPVIIFATILFWPVGLFLLITRVAKDKKTTLISSKIFKLLEIAMFVMAGFFALCFAICLTDLSDPSNKDIFPMFIGFTLIFVIGGLALRKQAKKTEAKAKKVKQYLAVVINGNARKLDNIASTVCKPYDVVKDDISKMISDGYFKNAFIDEGTREIVLPQDRKSVIVEENAEVIVQEKVAVKTVSCPCCGANNTISGNTGVCEYCDSPLEA